MKYMVEIYAHNGFVAGQTPRFSEQFDTLEKAQTYINNFIDAGVMKIENIRVYKIEELLVAVDSNIKMVPVETNKKWTILE